MGRGDNNPMKFERNPQGRRRRRKGVERRRRRRREEDLFCGLRVNSSTAIRIGNRGQQSNSVCAKSTTKPARLQPEEKGEMRMGEKEDGGEEGRRGEKRRV